MTARARQGEQSCFLYGDLLVAVVLGALLLGLLAVPIASFVWSRHEHRQLLGIANHNFKEMLSKRPPDVSATQWERAILWTDNLIGQIYNTGHDTGHLRILVQKMAAKSDTSPDLAMLRWIWEECEHAETRNSHLAVKFRNPKLLTRGPITDDRLPTLWSLHKVVELDLTDTQVTDAGLVHLKDLSNVKYLYLSGTDVTDEGLAHIKAMTGLQCLQLNNTAITDEGIMQLRDMASLEELSVYRTAVTPEGKEKLRKARPDLAVGR